MRYAIAVLALSTSAGALAADLLPLRNGIFVPVNVACKGASNADMVNYWGGRSSIGVAQAGCTIRTLKKAGTTYTIADRCKDNQSGEEIVGGPTVLKIASPTAFSMAGVAYRYCGPKPVW